MQGLDFLKLLANYSATRLLERDDFSLRMKEQKPIFLSELVYPVLQGYDSVMLSADIELGGTDQIFNLLVGRDMQRDFTQEPQVVMTMPLLEGTDGVQKMSKSYDNYIGINEAPREMFGKVMSVSDDLMFKYYELLTDEDLAQVKELHPKDAKVRLAQLIVACYHGSAAGVAAREEFQRVFSDKQIPDDILEYVTDATQTVVTILVKSGLAPSGNEARRLLQQQAVSFNDVKVSQDVVIANDGILKVGSRRFLRVVMKP
jgi:tyrosyl-tRNA synthetase